MAPSYNKPEQHLMERSKKLHARRDGFTLVELMVTLAVLAIIVGIGVPGFRDLIAPSRMQAYVSLYTQAIQTARHIAVNRNRTVSLCELDAQKRCTGRWGPQLDLFFDEERDGVLQNDNDTIMRVDMSTAAPMQVAWRGFGQSRFLSVRGNGAYRQNGRFTFCATDKPEDPGRALVINVTGRSRVESTKCTR